MFEARNDALDKVYCTFKVLELARKHRWTGARFELATTPFDRSLWWNGIRYLGRKWPPVLQPPEPSAGKTPAEWLEANVMTLIGRGMDIGERHRQLVKIRFALLWLGGEVLDGLIVQLDHESPLVRRDAAYLIDCACKRERIELAPEVRERIAAVQAEPRLEWEPD